MLIRSATTSDLFAITAIYNEVISNSDAIYREAEVDLSERAAWFTAKVDSGYPVLVAEHEGAVVGYGVFGNFRFGEGYDHTVEHSVHVRFDMRGQGVGKRILEELISTAIGQGRKIMVAAIDSKNIGSINLHTQYDFIETARMPHIAQKHGKLLTLVLMQKSLFNA